MKDKTIFTRRFSGHSGIGELMDDLGKAMASGDMLMLGGGNPASIPEVNALWKKRIHQLVTEEEEELTRSLVYYDTPQGNGVFMDAMADFLNRHYNFGITSENIAVTNGSQAAMFNLMNMLGGTGEDGVMRKVLFPLVPEYIGYADQHLEPHAFLSKKPKIELIGENRFKYHIDFEALKKIDQPLGAVCVSRPTNPSGNVLTDHEIDNLRDFCRLREIPLIIDNAYGAPFPQILFQEIKPVWDENIILSMSLSKVGLPNTRTGIVVARKEMIKALASVNAITSLSTGTLGQTIAYPLLQDDSLINISHEVVKPFYQKKSEKALQWVDQYLKGIPYRAHVSEGAMFLWLWLPELSITTAELYERLKQKKLLVIPGKYFFFGLEKHWPHRDQCIRITYSQAEETVEQGIRLIAEEISGL